MKAWNIAMKTSFLLPALLNVALSVTLCAANPDELRAEAGKLIEQAQQARAQGRVDEAQALKERVKGIEGQLHEQLAAGGSQPDAIGAEHAGREAEQVRRQIEDLRRVGKVDEAAQLEKKFAECNRLRDGEKPERLRHLMEAIEHLRAAGLNAPAESLSRIADQMRAELEPRGDSAVGSSPDKTQNALRELREAVMQMRGQMDKMQHQIEEVRARAGKPRGE
jgi:phage shock protein A